ncbi:hypothetical protein F2Q68_00033456 [Brassica cretica]|uniref:Uncharacterized protein n=1 Tax=Brassica cretica TaxID=69181 RepID=A0A8S9H2E7_BRACR|nr:hypothetical protein F2Q68_00033456 [Brassica cretica]
MRKLISSDLFVCHGNSYEDDEHDLKMGVLRRSRQLLPAFAEVVYLLRCEMESYGSRRVDLQSSSHHFCRAESPCLLKLFCIVATEWRARLAPRPRHVYRPIRALAGAKEIRDGGPKQLGVESKCVASLSRLKETELVTVILSQGRDRASYHNKAQAAIFNEFTTRRFCQLGKLVSRSSAEKQGLATTELALMERRSCRLWSSIHSPARNEWRLKLARAKEATGPPSQQSNARKSPALSGAEQARADFSTRVMLITPLPLSLRCSF